MDFAALMNTAMGKKKPTASSNTTTTKPDTEGEPPKPKYQKRSDIEAARQEAYAAEQRALEEQRTAKAAAKRKAEEDAALEKEEREEKRRKLAVESRKRREDEEWEAEQARRKRLGLSEKERVVEGEEADQVDGDEDVEEEELRTKLRELGHPVVLFGEGHGGRVKRYMRLTVKMTDGPIPTTLEPVEGADVKVDNKMPEDKTGRKWVYRQIASYFTMILSAYEAAMEAEREDTASSRNAYSTMVQTRENMKPLFRKMEKDDMPPDLLKPIIEIVAALQERRYVDANDGYLRLSIGKAAWPIGVTMVGIHERSAREKLHDGEKGHVMGDEITRKFLQSIKRCLTFAQVRWPPTDVRQLMG